MAQLDFSIYGSETELLIEFIFSTGSKIVYDLDYDTPQKLRANNLLEFKRINKRSGLFFIENDLFSNEPLSFKNIQKNGEEKFYIEQRKGGPTLELFLTQPYFKQTIEFIGHGFISYYSYYISSINSKEHLKVSNEQKILFKKITDYLRSRSQMVSGKNRKYFISHSVIEKINTGAQLSFIDIEK